MTGNLAELLPRMRYRDEADNASETEFDVDEVRRAREDLWRRIPPCHRGKQSELAARIRDKSILDAALAWNWQSPCLLICAPTDQAKSAAAALIAIRLMARGRESEYELWKGIRWCGANRLMNAARGWPLGNGECPDVRVASTCRLLILDDLGNEVEWQSTMFDVTQERYEHGLKNIVTTGLSPRQLCKRYGECILRRLVQRDGNVGSIVNLCSEEAP